MKYLLLAVFTCVIQNTHAQTIRLATYQYAENDRIKNITPLADYLGKTTGYAITVKSYPDIPAFIKAMQNEEVDIALISTFGYFLLDASSKKNSMQPYLTLDVKKNAVNNYKTAILCHVQSDILKLADVKQKAIGLRATLVAPGSTSGNLVPRLAFNGAGIPEMEKAFKSVNYSKTHSAAIQQLLKDSTDIAAMGYTEYEKLQQQDSLTAAQLRLIWTSPEIPLGPVLFNNKLEKKVRQNIINKMLLLEKEDNQALTTLKAGWSEGKQATGYIPINADFYNSFKSILGNKNALRDILNKFAN